MAINSAAEEIFHYLKLGKGEDLVEKEADVIFVLGGSTLSPVNKAAELYRRGFAPYISFISVGGTFGAEWGMSEAKKYHQTFLELGVPDEVMCWTELSSNTLEEARLSIPFMREHGLSPREVILVARPIHQRRAWATFKKQWPSLIFYNCPADENLTEADIPRLIQELERIKRYGDRGDLLLQQIPDEVVIAWKEVSAF